LERENARLQKAVSDLTEEEDVVTTVIIQLARQLTRYGYRKFTRLFRYAGCWIDHKRVERIWKQEGLKVPQSIWNEGGCGSPMVHISG